MMKEKRKKERLRTELIDGLLVVPDGGDVLDDDEVVGVLALLCAGAHLLLSLVEKVIALDHVIDDARLGDLLGLKKARWRKRFDQHSASKGWE
jgi:hypothetical protein